MTEPTMIDPVAIKRRRQISRQSAQSSKAGDHVAHGTSMPIRAETAQRARTSPDRLTSVDILALQGTIGNQAVQRLVAGVQRKPLSVGPANDQYEQEADRVADQVLRMPDKRAGEAMQRTPLAGAITPLVQRQDDLDEDELRTERAPDVQRANLDGSFDPGRDFQSRLAHSRGDGQPLSEHTRTYMEARFETDLSNVRVHTGSESIQMNREINAQAFTHGSDIYMGAGKYNPNTANGKHLLAHELTHTIQQGGSRPTAQRKLANTVHRSGANVIQRGFGNIGWREMMSETSRVPKFTQGSTAKLKKANADQELKYKSMSRRQLKKELAKERARYWATKILFNAAGPGMFDRAVFWLPRIIDKLSTIDVHFANLIKVGYNPGAKPEGVSTVRSRQQFRKGKIARAGVEDWLKGGLPTHNQRRAGLPGTVEFGEILLFIKNEAYKYRKARIKTLKSLLYPRGPEAGDQD